MKNSILLFLALSILCVACNKEEDFYAKSDPIESTNSTSGDEGGGDDSGVEGGAAGGTVGGSVGGAVGGTVGGAVGGTVGGAVGGTVGGAVGGTVGGAVGGVVGGAVGGTTGGGKVPVDAIENFVQNESDKKLDIVWIVDNSGSMADEQAALATNFDAFIKEFIMKDVDFKMAITTTDTKNDNAGKIAGASNLKLTSAMAKANETQFINDFKSIIKVGITGTGDERGLEASEAFLSKHQASFLRPDAYLAIVIISDEEDSSAKTPAEYAALLKASKANAGLVKVYSIVDTGKTNSGSGIKVGYERYDAVSKATAGVTANIRNDFFNVLTEMGDSIINLLDSFALAADPIAGTLKVYVNNKPTTSYTYTAASRSIKFNANALPPEGAAIKVEYQKLP